MYLDYYGLSDFPFNITANPEFFYSSASHQEALAALMYGVNERKGIIVLTGEVGTGKTTLCRSLLNRLDTGIKTSLVLNPYFNATQLLEALIQDFGLTPAGKTRLQLLNQLNAFLLETARAGSTAAIIIDEAQNLSVNQLEQVRLLSNLETSQAKLLQIILSGQPELEDKLNLHKLRQLKQRIGVRCRLCALSPEEMKNYIACRLEKAASRSISIPEESYEIIYGFSRGIPRLVNVICDRALLCGFARETKNLSREVFEACVKELS